MTFKVKLKNKTADMFIYGDIGETMFGEGISAKTIKDEMKAASGMALNVHINSPGGSMFEGVAIMNLLRSHNKTVNVSIDGLAASAASVIAMGGDNITMADNAMLMIHKPWTFAMGNANELRDTADLLDTMNDSVINSYSRASISLEEISNMMDEETWLGAEQALEVGLIDDISEPMQIAASYNKKILNKFNHVPDELIKESKVTSISNYQRAKMNTAKLLAN